MRLDIDLDEIEVPEMPEFMAIPDGKYRAMIIESDYKPTANGLGECLHLTFQILDGPHQNRRLKDFLTLEHTNETTKRIAREKLKRLALAMHFENGKVGDTEELHSKPVVLTVSREKTDSDFGDSEGFQNRIKKYSEVDVSTLDIEPKGNENPNKEAAWG
jgi:hypothetical protein